MACIAPLQYAWTLLAPSLATDNAWSLAQVQLAFTFFVVAQTVIQPAGGYLMDHGGLAVCYGLAGPAIVVGWAGLAWAHELAWVYALYGLAGAGAGLAYAGAIASAIHWFPTRRGFALGAVAAGFGGGAAPLIPLINWLAETHGPDVAFVITGVAIGIVVAVAGQLLRHPLHHQCAGHPDAPSRADQRHATGAHPWRLLRDLRFWTAFFAFFFMATGLLILTANTKPLGQDFGLSSQVIVIAVTLQQVMNALSRIVWGAVSDRRGRAVTMATAFLLNAAILVLIPVLGTQAVAFIILTSLALFTAGEIFALFPAMTADLFGTRYAAANQGMLYTAKGLAALTGGAIAAWLAASQSWLFVFAVAGLLALASSGMVLTLRSHDASSQAGAHDAEAT